MGVRNGQAMKTAPDSIQTLSPELSFPAAFFWQLLAHFAKYRTELPVKEVVVFPNGDAYYVCPNCHITVEREFMSYCDRCGQHLGWKGYKKAKVIYPGNRKEVHI